MALRADHRRSLGAFGETYAVHQLERRGYVIEARNVGYRSGEIDIVARDGEELVFVEVKTRRSSEFATPEDAITHDRMSHLESAIVEYLGERDIPYRIEVVAIEIDRAGRVARCDVLPDVGLR